MISSNSAGLLMDSGEIVGTDGSSIGKVGQVYLDNETGALTWVTVKTGWFGSNESFVPLDDATLDGSTVTVPYDKAKVKDAPHHAVDAELSPDEEQDLYAYYGLAASGGAADAQYGTASTGDLVTEAAVADTAASDSAVSDTAVSDTAVAPVANGSGDGYITRSEEQLRVGTRQVETGRARLKKFVVTEQQTVTVPVSHDEVTLVREPIAEGAVTDAVIGDDVIEVVLTEDQVVVDKQAVAVEKIKLDTETVTEQQQVTEAVRKEQVELDTDGVTAAGTTGVRSDAADHSDAASSLTDKAKGLADKAKNAVK
ncbi:DUF2382 domain-containing protein [Nakamurella flava]|uniref:DUF2382 domain-containing protein n=1 Tax=Nakamurella flava TaxID=2576308 RepID=A0A4U6QAB9_9ACTN|nr:PRC and DUF2382 domain-containing protein [Nakamurella flava]TKV56858.1 DUF2382 domain-containing protein [Nakamurella flava]